MAYFALNNYLFTGTKIAHIRGMTKNCKICGKEFQAGGVRYAYCSTDCYRKACHDYNKEYNRVRRSIPSTRICPICKNEFNVSILCKKYCSKECAKIGGKEATKKNYYYYTPSIKSKVVKTKKYCLDCGKTFESTGNNNRLCDYCRKQEGEYHEPYRVAL